jgi:hypothetical protein
MEKRQVVPEEEKLSPESIISLVKALHAMSIEAGSMTSYVHSGANNLAIRRAIEANFATFLEHSPLAGLRSVREALLELGIEVGDSWSDLKSALKTATEAWTTTACRHSGYVRMARTFLQNVIRQWTYIGSWKNK